MNGTLYLQKISFNPTLCIACDKVDGTTVERRHSSGHRGLSEWWHGDGVG